MTVGARPHGYNRVVVNTECSASFQHVSAGDLVHIVRCGTVIFTEQALNASVGNSSTSQARKRDRVRDDAAARGGVMLGLRDLAARKRGWTSESESNSQTALMSGGVVPRESVSTR